MLCACTINIHVYWHPISNFHVETNESKLVRLHFQCRLSEIHICKTSNVKVQIFHVLPADLCRN